MEALLNVVGLPNTPKNALYSASAIEWIKEHTILEIDVEKPTELPASVQLFVFKYAELLKKSFGVASESISGLSQSFVTGQSLESQIYELATALFGNSNIKSTVTVFSGEDGWDYGC